MYGFKIVFGFCLLFLLGTGIYFVVSDGYTTVNVSTYRGLREGQQLNGFSILYLFVVMAGLYFFTLWSHKQDQKKTKHKK